MPGDLDDLIATLQANNGDRSDIEVKSAQGGYPTSLASTLSAMANLPGGGLVILGLDESNQFEPISLNDPQALKQALGSQARKLAPPVRLTIDDAEVEGFPVIVATVHECDPSAKPCRVGPGGPAYLRSHDGDYELSEIEIQAFLTARKAPHFDRAPVVGTSTDDLDHELVGEWLATVRRENLTALGRFKDDDELLRRAGVITSSGELSLAGLLTLGAYPQQYLPRYVIQTAASPLPSDPPGTRARNAATIDGPLPVMIASFQQWTAQNMSKIIRGDSSGNVRDEYDFPLEAVRELVTNALIHRDLDIWSEGFAVEVRLQADQFVVTNPGGLYGVKAAQLGLDPVTSARNQRLVNLCQYAHLPGQGLRVVEGLATGLPKVARELAASGLPPARYFDKGIRFTAVLNSRQQAPKQSAAQAVRNALPDDLPPNTNLTAVYNALETPRSAAEIAVRTGLTIASIRTALHSLRNKHGLVEQVGGRGRHTTYRRRPRADAIEAD